MPGKKSLHSLQGQFSGTHNLTLSLNFSRLVADFKLLGSILFQTMGPKFLNDYSPLYTVFISGLIKVTADLNVEISLCWNIF